MLKNRTRDQIKKKFSFNPLDLKVINKRVAKDEEVFEPYSQPDVSAYTVVPNYLEPPAFSTIKPIKICLFQIVVDSLHPFLLYFLQQENGIADFITFLSFDRGRDKKKLKPEAIDFLTTLLPRAVIDYAGFLEMPETNVLIFKYADAAGVDYKQTPANYYWATAHEIFNLKRVIEWPVSSTVVVPFFQSNPEFLIVKNADEVIYETPVVGYYQANRAPSRIELMDIYREIMPDFTAIGKCYFFNQETSKAELNCVERPIMRVALFLRRAGLESNISSPADFHSFVLSSNKGKYGITHYAQHTPLSYH